MDADVRDEISFWSKWMYM